jgi:tripartite-type tricarboxylate transporter receptor subunit TctC
MTIMKMTALRRGFILGTCVFAAAPFAVRAANETSPIHLIVPFAAGGPTDVLARIYAKKLTEDLGQSVIVENRPGAGTLIGTQYVAQGPADGTRVLLTTAAVAVNPVLYKHAGYKMEDLALVGSAGIFNQMMLSSPSFGPHTLRDLVAYAKANPGKLSWASLGVGSASQLVSQRFIAASGIKAVEVPYKGDAPAQLAVVRGEVAFVITGATAEHLKPGQTFPMAVASEKRLPTAPNVPTFVEAGYPNMVATVWFGVFVPVATPKATVDRLAKAVEQANKSPDVQKQATGLGISMFPGNKNAFAEFVKKDRKLIEADAARLCVKLDD